MSNATRPTNSTAPQLSIIVPSFNEELRLPPSLELIASYVKSSGRSTEVLVVDDGSSDRTAEVAAAFADRIANLRVVKNGENRGKGYSVRHGMQEAKGDFVLFTDADLSAPIEEADKLIDALKQYDVAIGSRAMNRELIDVHESAFREFPGIIFTFVAPLVFRLPFWTTHSCFK